VYDAEDDRMTFVDSVGPSSSSTMLVQAVLSGDQMMVQRLLRGGGSVLERSTDGLSLLHLCAATNNKGLAQYILEQDPENNLLNAKDSNRRTPFMLAVEEQSIEVASLLIERGCTLGNFVSNTMYLLESGEDDEEVRKLLQPLSKRMNSSPRGPYLVHKAIKSEKLSLLELYLQSGFDPNVKDENGALHSPLG
jgi:ankyrin repeat protein